MPNESISFDATTNEINYKTKQEEKPRDEMPPTVSSIQNYQSQQPSSKAQ
jgi:hypothetical protein